MISRDEAYSLLCEYNKAAVSHSSCRDCGGRYALVANQLGYGEDADFLGDRRSAAT